MKTFLTAIASYLAFILVISLIASALGMPTNDTSHCDKLTDDNAKTACYYDMI